MKFSIRLNNDLTASEYIELSQKAEQLGFDQFWVSNDLFFRSAVAILSAVACRTRRIHLGTCILNPYTMNPAEIAMAAGTLDELSEGRFMLGLSAGASSFLDWIGLKHDRPVAYLRETTEAIRALLNNQSTGGGANFLKWSDHSSLKFQVKHNVPIYIGGVGPKIQALAGELADGLLPLLLPPEAYYSTRDNVYRGIGVRKDQSRQFDLVGSIWVSASKDPEAARNTLARKIAYYGEAMNPDLLSNLGLTNADFRPITQALIVERDEIKAVGLITDAMLKVGIVGESAEIIARLEPLVEDGLNHLSFGPPLGPNMGEALDILGKVVEHFSKSES